MKTEETETATKEQVDLLVQKYRKAKHSQTEKLSTLKEGKSEHTDSHVAEVTESTYFGEAPLHTVYGHDNEAFEGDSESNHSEQSQGPSQSTAELKTVSKWASSSDAENKSDAALEEFKKVNTFQQFTILLRYL